jgi:hypothetical protein
VKPLEDGYDIRTVQELLGHRDVATRKIDTRVLNRGGRGVLSHADRLPSRSRAGVSDRTTSEANPAIAPAVSGEKRGEHGAGSQPGVKERTESAQEVHDTRRSRHSADAPADLHSIPSQSKTPTPTPISSANEWASGNLPRHPPGSTRL